MSKIKWVLMIVFALLSWQVSANETMQDVEVVKLGTYQGNSGHFVWFTSTTEECKVATPSNPVLTFDDSQTGGKALFATLMAALLNKRKVDVQTNGCAIFEVYLK